MDLNTLSFFINDEPLVQLNPNVLESNVQNIVILLGILIYANNVSFSVSLENRQINTFVLSDSSEKH